MDMAVKFEGSTEIAETSDKGARADVYPKENRDVESKKFWEAMVGFSSDFLPKDTFYSGASFDTTIVISENPPDEVNWEIDIDAVFEAKMRVSWVHEVKGNEYVELETIDCEQYIYDLSFPKDELPDKLHTEGGQCYVSFGLSYQKTNGGRVT